MSDPKNDIAALLGTLFEFVLEHSGGVPDEIEPEEWLSGCRITGTELRDRLRDLAMDYPFRWDEMGLSKAQRRWLGLPDDTSMRRIEEEIARVHAAATKILGKRRI